MLDVNRYLSLSTLLNARTKTNLKIAYRRISLVSFEWILFNELEPIHTHTHRLVFLFISFQNKTQNLRKFGFLKRKVGGWLKRLEFAVRGSSRNESFIHSVTCRTLSFSSGHASRDIIPFHSRRHPHFFLKAIKECTCTLWWVFLLLLIQKLSVTSSKHV